MSNVKMIVANKSNKQALFDWDDFLESIRNSTPVDHNETQELKAKRMKHLEKPGNEEEWIEYYFPKYCFCKPAKFQIKSFRKILRADKSFFQRRAWFRGSSKTTRRMFEVLYLKFVRKLQVCALLVSKNNDNATRLLDSYMATLEANQRLINDYGIQERPGKWTHGEFTTRDKSTFRAVGAGQNPRGAKNEELRVNVLIFDDVDDDEVCRNPERLQQVWEWIQEAVIPTVDISRPYYIFVDNNIIAKDSIAVKAAEFATDVETINIRDEEGKSTWPEKNSEEDIDSILNKISYESGQKEYFNNPLTLGQTFKEIRWDKCPPLSKLQFVLQYADPATSNRDKPTAKSKASNSCKGTGLLGFYDGKFYLYTCYLDNMSNSSFVESLYAIRQYVNNKVPLYSFIENNSLQDPFYQQVLLPIIFDKGKQNGGALMISPDDTKKPEKWYRIEADLEPLVRLGMLIFNQEEKNNKHMKRMESQFLTANPNSRELGGPDIIQGGYKIIQNKIAMEAAGGFMYMKRKPNSKRF